MRTNRQNTEINGGNVALETYYNLVRLCEITGYSDPIGALRTTGETVTVVRDACGNILSGTVNPCN